MCSCVWLCSVADWIVGPPSGSELRGRLETFYQLRAKVVEWARFSLAPRPSFPLLLSGCRVALSNVFYSPLLFFGGLFEAPLSVTSVSSCTCCCSPSSSPVCLFRRKPCLCLAFRARLCPSEPPRLCIYLPSRLLPPRAARLPPPLISVGPVTNDMLPAFSPALPLD